MTNNQKKILAITGIAIFIALSIFLVKSTKVSARFDDTIKSSFENVITDTYSNQ